MRGDDASIIRPKGGFMAFSKIPIGNNAPDVINAVIEIPLGSHHKYEYDEQLDEIRLDRVLHSAVFYPTEYGFIPHTRSGDGDHLDVLVIISEPTFPGCIIEARSIGVLDMEDNAGQDWKIIAIAEKDPRLAEIHTIDDLDEHTKKEIVNFFEVYKQLEDKLVTVNGWLDKERTHQIIKDAHAWFKQEVSVQAPC